MKDFIDGVSGLLLIFALGYGAYWYFTSGEDLTIAGEEFEMTLGNYKAISAERRRALVDAYSATREIAPENTEAYRVCMGDFAPEKSETLKFKEVFGWCETEAANAPQRFADRFDELDAPDYATEAGVICERFIQERIRMDVDFPWGEKRIARLGHMKYRAIGTIERVTAIGTVRNTYECEIQFTGGGEWAESRNWTTHALNVY